MYTSLHGTLGRAVIRAPGTCLALALHYSRKSWEARRDEGGEPGVTGMTGRKTGRRKEGRKALRRVAMEDK